MNEGSSIIVNAVVLLLLIEVINSNSVLLLSITFPLLSYNINLLV